MFVSGAFWALFLFMFLPIIAPKANYGFFLNCQPNASSKVEKNSDDETFIEKTDYDWLSQRRVTESDLEGKSKQELRIMRNYIFARHGYIFKQKKMINYFSNQRWYVKSKNKVTTDDLSEIEYANVMLIKKVENEGFSNDDQDYSNVDFIIPDSSYRKVTSKELKSLSSYELAVARNEIYARHGYIFVSNEWKDFFVGRYWYTPTSKDVTLNSVEEYNVSMILKEEATR